LVSVFEGFLVKILTISLGMDLKLREGCTPVLWQLFKALYQEEVEIVDIPLRGDNLETLWWRSTANPCRRMSDFGSAGLKLLRRDLYVENVQPVVQSAGFGLAGAIVRKSLERKILQTLLSEKDFDCILFMSVDLRLVSKLAPKIRASFSIPVLFFEADMPVALPNYYNMDLSVFDAIITNSKGVENVLKKLGASKVFTLYYAADPDLYSPLDVEEDIDIFFFGYGSHDRKHWIDVMLNAPSLAMKDVRFAVGGRIEVVSSVKTLGDIPFALYRKVCCRSKLSLNITRSGFAEVYGSSNVRPFELAALGRCFVMNPTLGIEEWFEPGREVVVPKDEDEILEIYKWLLSTPDERKKIGRRARQRLLREHTYRNRAKQLIGIIKSLAHCIG